MTILQKGKLGAALRYASATFKRGQWVLPLAVLGLVIAETGTSGTALAQGGGPTGSFSEAVFEDDLIRNSVGNLFKLIEGAFGALVMVVAGLGAIIAASMGAYRASVGMLVVAVGAFILRALVSLFFGSDFVDYEANG